MKKKYTNVAIPEELANEVDKRVKKSKLEGLRLAVHNAWSFPPPLAFCALPDRNTAIYRL